MRGVRMRLRLEEKSIAQKMRREGFSYREIQAKLPTVSKSTLSGWLKQTELSPMQQERIIQKMRISGSVGRQKGAFVNKEARRKRLSKARLEAIQNFPKLLCDPLFSVGLMLYWAEGAKTSEMFQFVNSSPELIQIMVRWLTTVCRVPAKDIRVRVYAHLIYAHEQPEREWQRITGLPVS